MASVVTVLMPYLYELGRLIVVGNQRVAFYGDVALEELATRDVWRGHQLLGPYSRFGWHHPGPALFYALAVPVRIFGANGPGLLFGTVLINALSAAAIVLLVCRRAGWAAGLWASATLSVLYLVLGAWFVRDAWNPYVVVMPMVLFVVLAADGVTASVASFFWAAVVGSFAVQTHISTGPVVVILLAVASVVIVTRWWRDPSTRKVSAAAVAGLVVAVSMWLPPLIDAVRHHPSNLHRLWSFFTSPHPTHGLTQSAKAALASATVLPLGLPPSIVEVPARSAGVLAASALALLLVSAVALVAGFRRWQPLALALTGASWLGLVAALAGNTRAVGMLAAYLTLWQLFVAVTLVLAVGVAVMGLRATRVTRPAHSRILRGGWVPGLSIMVVGTLTLATSVLGVIRAAGLPAPRDDRGHASSPLPGLAAAYRTVEASLGPQDHVVRVTISTSTAWPIAAGLSLDLERNGHRTTVAGATGDWLVLFGERRRPTGREGADIELYEPGPDQLQGPAPRGSPIEKWESVTFFLNRSGPANTRS